VVWALDLRRRTPKDRPWLTAVFVSQSEELADNPDNITISPGGGLVLCEDGSGLVVDGARRFGTRLLGVNRQGGSFVFAENNVVIDQPIPGKPAIVPDDYRGFEFCGATFSVGAPPVRQHPDARHHLRHRGAVAAGQPLVGCC
jgi:Bacterial protein of unknown function (DUF839)